MPSQEIKTEQTFEGVGNQIGQQMAPLDGNNNGQNTMMTVEDEAKPNNNESIEFENEAKEKIPTNNEKVQDFRQENLPSLPKSTTFQNVDINAIQNTPDNFILLPATTGYNGKRLFTCVTFCGFLSFDPILCAEHWDTMHKNN